MGFSVTGNTTIADVRDGAQGPQGPQGPEGPAGEGVASFINMDDPFFSTTSVITESSGLFTSTWVNPGQGSFSFVTVNLRVGSLTRATNSLTGALINVNDSLVLAATGQGTGAFTSSASDVQSIILGNPDDNRMNFTHVLGEVRRLVGEGQRQITVRIYNGTDSTTANSVTYRIDELLFANSLTESGQVFLLNVTMLSSEGTLPTLNFAEGANNLTFEFNLAANEPRGPIVFRYRNGTSVPDIETTSHGQLTEIWSTAHSDSGSFDTFPVNRDQFWLFASPSAEDPNSTDALVLIYDGTTSQWIVQDEVIDGNLLVSGTVTAGQIATNTITSDLVAAGQINADLLDLDGPLIMDADNSAIIAGRNESSSDSINGLYFGRAPNSGFQFSGITSSSNIAQGIVLDNSQGLNIYEPILWSASGIDMPGFITYTTTGSRTLAAGAVYRIVVLGAGGGGGGGGDDDNNNATDGTAGTSTVVTISGAPQNNGTYTATGGAGGQGGLGGDRGASRAQAGGAGQASFAGPGGTGGASGGAAGQDSPSRGAGGGGSAGANDSSFGRRAGEGGLGGRAGQETEIVIDLTGTTTDATINVTTIGTGGTGGIENVGSTQTARAGTGGDGAVYVSSAFGGYFAYSITDLLNGVDYYRLPAETTDPASFTITTTNRLGPFAERRIVLGTMQGTDGQNEDLYVSSTTAGRRFRFDWGGLNIGNLAMQTGTSGERGTNDGFFREDNVGTAEQFLINGANSGGHRLNRSHFAFRCVMDPGIQLRSGIGGRNWVIFSRLDVEGVSEISFNIAYNQARL